MDIFPVTSLARVTAGLISHDTPPNDYSEKKYFTDPLDFQGQIKK